MKKLFLFLTLIWLASCNQIEPDVLIECLNPQSPNMVLIVETQNSQITTWTVREVLTREDFEEAFLSDIFLTEREILELFDEYNDLLEDGFSITIVHLSISEVTLITQYDYLLLSEETINDLWQVESFSEMISLNAILEGLETEGYVCEINERVIELD